ncbi:hypothetical protein NC651_012305 [Populus alba x Populus x berolinensis]|nr:hypothetical protein NC651_012305 [Populus alba x Populus x berolinensis]
MHNFFRKEIIRKVLVGAAMQPHQFHHCHQTIQCLHSMELNGN